MARLHKILREKCWACHKFRMTPAKVALYRVKLLLADCGDLSSAMDLDKRLARVAAEHKSAADAMQRQQDILAGIEAEARAKLEAYAARVAHQTGNQAIPGATHASPISQYTYKPLPAAQSEHVRAFRRETIRAFMDSMPKAACQNCQAPTLSLRWDASGKLFLKTPMAKTMSQMASKGVQYVSASAAAHGKHELLIDPHAALAGTAPGASAREKYINALEAEAQLRLLFDTERDICRLIWAPNTSPRIRRAPDGWQVFFVRTLFVTPSRFRPPTKLGDKTFDHTQNHYLTRVLNAKLALQQAGAAQLASGHAGSGAALDLADIVSTWMKLQDAVVGLMDSSRVAERDAPGGIRQLLERKEGLFRMHMMGKRVNYAARSVISPDPFIRPDQVGVPLKFARTLTYPTPVTPWNVEVLRQAVINGADMHPGANALELENGEIINLAKLNRRAREALARGLLAPSAGGATASSATLRAVEDAAGAGFKAKPSASLTGPSDSGSDAPVAPATTLKLDAETDVPGASTDAAGADGGAASSQLATTVTAANLMAWRGVGKRVWRHLQDGDVVLMNRQPTLHKPSIMAHRVRVLRAPTHQTLRMHYVNCKSYNADFDGDEMNMHFPQDEISRAEGYTIAATERQYVVPTTGQPLRGLIQDHISVGVMLTQLDRFLDQDMFQQLMFSAVQGLPSYSTMDVLGASLRASAGKLGSATSAALSLGLGGTSGANNISRRLRMPPPAVLKPRKLWTGKQLVTALLQALTADVPSSTDAPVSITVEAKAKVPANAWVPRLPGDGDCADPSAIPAGFKQELKAVGDHQLVIRQNTMVTGVLDKSALGTSTYGIVHATYELLGPDRASGLLSGLGRLLTVCLQYASITCGMDDLVLTGPADAKRRELVIKAYDAGARSLGAWAGVDEPSQAVQFASASAQLEPAGPGAWAVDAARQAGIAGEAKPWRCAQAARQAGNVHSGRVPGTAGLPLDAFSPPPTAAPAWSSELRAAVAKTVTGLDARGAAALAGLDTTEVGAGVDLQVQRMDGAVKGALQGAHSGIIDAALPTGLYKSFPDNMFSLIVTTGAKGSKVNHAMIVAGLGQQELEGRRVPLQVSGKSLPCFMPWDASARAGGYIADRFLTGLRPADYYFHCMSGREGLVDTAVKTARSGYLQRCLIKHLEDLKVTYDGTVRNGDGAVMQFVYGEDGVDVTNGAYLPPAAGTKELAFLKQNQAAELDAGGLRNMLDGLVRNGVDASSGPEANQRTSRASAGRTLAARSLPPHDQARSGLDVYEYRAGEVLEVRRPTSGHAGFVEGGVSTSWVRGVVVAVHRDSAEAADKSSKKAKKSKKSKRAAVTSYDVQMPARPEDVVRAQAAVAADAAHAEELVAAVGGHGTSLPKHPTMTVHSVKPWDAAWGWVMRPVLVDPVAQTLPQTGSHLGAVTERMQSSIEAFIARDPELSADAAAASQFRLMMYVKGQRALACPGEPVGVLAGQSVGEPSTQMTLNTFHLAGSGGVNVTLGIPRLREIVMTASKNIATPAMTLPIQAHAVVRKLARSGTASAPDADAVNAAASALANKVAMRMNRLALSLVVDFTQPPPLPTSVGSGATATGGGIAVTERLRPLPGMATGNASPWVREYTVTLQLVPASAYQAAYGLQFADVASAAARAFVPALLAEVSKQVRKAAPSSSVGSVAARGVMGTLGSGTAGDKSDEPTPESSRLDAAGALAHESGDEQDEVETGDGSGDVDGTLRLGNQAETRGYDEGEPASPAPSDVASEDVAGSPTGAGAGAAAPAVLPEEDENFEPAMPGPKGVGALGTARVGMPSDGSDFVPGKVTRVVPPPAAGRSSAFRQMQVCADAADGSQAGWLRVTLCMPASQRKVLMITAAEAAVRNSVLRSTARITRAVVGAARLGNTSTTVVDAAVAADAGASGIAAKARAWLPAAAWLDADREVPVIQTEGVNFPAVWAHAGATVDLNRIKTNDIGSILKHYGVEATRAAVVREVRAVFGVYGIDVDARHLGLIADYMTFTGDYRAMNRLGMQDIGSPYQQMSFETTTRFLTAAALHTATGYDAHASPSASVSVGAVAKTGTGAFEIRHDMEALLRGM